MNMMAKNIRYLYISKCYKLLFPLTNTSHKYQSQSRFHSAPNLNVKSYIENENKHAYNIMENNGYILSFSATKDNLSSLTREEYESVLEKDWRKETPQTIFQMFSRLSIYCSEQNICISSKQFDDYIDCLTDNIKNADDEELKTIIFELAKWPTTESIRTRNFIEVWAAVDDECFNRINKWSFDDMLSFLSLFYMINIIRVSDFAYKCLLKLAYKSKQLTKSQVVQTLFFIGTARRSPPDVHNLELYIKDHFTEFSVDELAISAMGLFKSKTPIRSMTLISNIIDKIKQNSKEVHEVSLTSLLKVIRYSMKITTDDRIYDLLDSLQYEVPRLSIMCNVHMAIAGTTTLTLHETCLTKIAERVTAKISDARLKDLERLVLTYGTFNFIPKTNNDFFSQIIDELSSPDREPEILKHGKSFACCVGYLGLLGIYPKDLMNKVLDPKFLEHSYGKSYHQYGREVLNIHNSSKIFLKDESMNELNEKQVVLLSKKYTDYIPCENYKKQYNVSEKMFLDVKLVLQNMRGGKQYVTGHHIVTHHQRGDLIICNNHEKEPLPVDKAFSDKRFGFICKPPDDNIWIALIIAGRNTMIRNHDSPTGHFSSKVRELNALGYHAAVIMWNVYDKLSSNEEKVAYINKLIENTVNRKLLPTK